MIGKENTNRYRFDIFQTSTPQLDIMIFKENGSSWTRNTLYKNQQKCVVFEALIDENTYHFESYQNIHFNEDRTISYPQLNTFDKMVRAGFSFLISEQFRTSLIGDKFETTQMTDDGRTYNVNVSGESFTVIFSYEL